MPALTATCHCGDVAVTVPFRPRRLTACNCSICRRLGSRWAYYDVKTVKFEGHPGKTASYIWGDKTLRVVRCKRCGVVTHWEPLDPGPTSRMGVNANNFDPKALGNPRVRRLDGASTWKFLD